MNDVKISEYDGKTRCAWAVSSQLMQDYHDTEWGLPKHNNVQLFELINLEGAQAGLSWNTILQRREGYRELFANFDPVEVAKFTDEYLEQILFNPAIIRNRLKVFSVVKNARAYLNMLANGEEFSEFLWGFVNDKPLKHSQKEEGLKISKRISKELRKRGFTFVGPTICYAFMQSAGMINDHVDACYHSENNNTLVF